MRRTATMTVLAGLVAIGCNSARVNTPAPALPTAPASAPVPPAKPPAFAVYNKEAVEAVYSYFGAIAAKDYKAAYALRSERTRTGYSLEQFRDSWAHTKGLKIIFAKQLSVNDKKAKVELVISQSDSVGKKVIRTPQRGVLELVWENGGWHFDGGKLGKFKGECSSQLATRPQRYLSGYGWGETFADQLRQDAGTLGSESKLQKRIRQGMAQIESALGETLSKKDLHEWKSGAMDGALARIRERYPNERFAPSLPSETPTRPVHAPQTHTPSIPDGPGYPKSGPTDPWRY